MNGIPIHESEAMMPGCWMGYDAAGRVVICAMGEKVLRTSDEPVASIVASADVYDALARLWRVHEQRAA